MIEEMGEDIVKSRVRCATLALGTAQAAVDQLLKDRVLANCASAPANKPDADPLPGHRRPPDPSPHASIRHRPDRLRRYRQLRAFARLCPA